MRCVNLIDKSVALAGGKCKCSGCNCRKCGSKCKCKMRVACVTRPMRPTRQKRLQNAENLLLKIRVESSNKLIQSACVAPSYASPILCPLASVCPLFAQCQPVYLRVRCTVPRRKACNTNQRIMACMAVFAESEREGEQATERDQDQEASLTLRLHSQSRSRSTACSCARACARPRISIILINLLMFINSDKFALCASETAALSAQNL